VANAYRHGEGRIELTVESGPDGVFARVGDEGTGAIASPVERPERGGWGLVLVDRLADGWGVEDGASRVWFRVGLDAD
jgi:two-component sensor histidine kinase